MNFSDLMFKKIKIKTANSVSKQPQFVIFYDFVGWLGISVAGLTCGCIQLVNQQETRPSWAIVGGTWVPFRVTSAWQSHGSVPSTSSYRAISARFFWPKQVTDKYRFKGRTNRLHLLMREVTESHHKFSRTGEFGNSLPPLRSRWNTLWEVHR